MEIVKQLDVLSEEEFEQTKRAGAQVLVESRTLWETLNNFSMNKKFVNFH